MSIMGGLLSSVLEEARSWVSAGDFARQFMIPITKYSWLFPPEGVEKLGGFDVLVKAQLDDKG